DSGGAERAGRLSGASCTPNADSMFPTVSICCCLFILFLFLSELTGFITTEVSTGRAVTHTVIIAGPDLSSGFSMSPLM
ncbi:hypothetical protein U0070_014171, partial [Myodes glareolus]